MEIVIAFVVGVLVGGVVMTFVTKKNYKDIAPLVEKVDDIIDNKIDPVFEKAKDSVK